jgi:cytoskeletal protein RodZ
METGEPISDAKIRIGSVESFSDYNGVYLMENVPVGTICVKTYALGYVRSYSDSIKIEPNTLVLLDFVLFKMVPAIDKIEVAQNARANNSLNLPSRHARARLSKKSAVWKCIL